MLEARFVELIAAEAKLPVESVARTVELLQAGAPIPFIAKYRKDLTGGLGEDCIEAIARQAAAFRALSDRRAQIIAELDKLGKLTAEVRAALDACADRTQLEDLYIPHRKGKRTKATVAREKGLQPLADCLLAQNPETAVEEAAAAYVRPEKAVLSIDEALEGARHILAERIAADPETRRGLREHLLAHGSIVAHATKNCEGKQTRYESFYAFSESVARIPWHRFLAIHRGVKEGFLRMELSVAEDAVNAMLASRYIRDESSACAAQVRTAIAEAWSLHLKPALDHEVMSAVRMRADDEAIRVFRENAENMLLAPPAGPIPVLGVAVDGKEPCRLAVVDASGAFAESASIPELSAEEHVEASAPILLALMEKHAIRAVAIGSSHEAREAGRLIKKALARLNGWDAFVATVHDAGAIIYASSKAAREEFPHLDAPTRRAVTIARRLQDPLAELVKMELRHIGVGQYQHDVNQKALKEGLHRTVVSCVSRVGVELNRASSTLLRYVCGLNDEIAARIVEYRSQHGGFKSRAELLNVPGMGPKVFEYCAGFLRLRDGVEPLDATGIHPEAYEVSGRIARELGCSIAELGQQRERLAALDLAPYQSSPIGRLTLEDIRHELLEPGRDPRRPFRVPKFLDGVASIQDLNEGMEVEGLVTNVTDFGAFVDIGVSQDGLVHLSELANRFVQDPREVVRVGDVVKVKVIKVDKAAPRISLSMKALLPRAETRTARPARPQPHARQDVEAAPRTDRGKPRRERPQVERREGSPRRRRPDETAERDRLRGGDRGGSQKREKERLAKLKSAVRGGSGPAPHAGSPTRHGDDASVNTQLADQLAALRDRLGS